MLHPLEHRIAQLRRCLRRWLVVYGVSCVLAAGLGAVLLLGMADYLVRFRDPGVRVILTIALLAVLGWTAYRYLYRSATVRLRDVDLARRLQRRFPQLSDSLASSIEFLKQPENEPTAGSPGLRRAVISQTTAETDRLEFSDVIDRRPAVRAATVAVAACLLAGIVAVLDPLSAQVAVARLAYPLGKMDWPRNFYLKLSERVDRVARGQAFEVEVVDAFGAKLPPNVRIHYRLEQPNGSALDETEPMRPLGEAMIARRENVVRPFSYRIDGGDDHSMDWIPVEVVEPPAVVSLSIALAPPEYTGWPAATSDGHIRALAGTRMRIEGTANQPLASAALCLDDGRIVAGAVSEDAVRFTVPAGGEPLVVEKSGTYWFKLVDREGLSGGASQRWELRVVPDQPPSVAIEQPGGAVFVTPEAEVPLRVAAKDDLAISRIDLVAEPPGASPSKPAQRTIPLYAGPDRAAPPVGGAIAGDAKSDGAESGDATADGAESGASRVVDYRWNLAELKLAPGIQVTFYAKATDYLPQLGKSDSRRLVVITPEQLIERIGQQQRFLLAELGRALEMERQSRDEAARLAIRLGELGRLDQLDIDHLQGADLAQRQAARVLSGASDGVPMHIENLLAELVNNKVDNPDIARRMQGLLDEIDRLGREDLDVIARELTAAIKTAQVRLEEHPKGPPPAGAAQPDAALATSLATAGERQDRVIASLERMLGQLTEWDNYRRFHREIGQLARKQEDLLRSTTELGRRTLGKDVKDLPAADVAQLKVAGRDQLELARLLDRLLQEMDQMREQLVPSDPLAADTIGDAVARGRELGTGGHMRAAGGHVIANRTGQATALQQQALDDLNELLDVLSNRRESELARLVKKLRQAETELAEIAEKQEGLRKAIEQAADQQPEAERASQLERLSRQQQELQKQAERMARRLERLLAQQAAKSTRAAAGKMGEAGKSAESGAGKNAAGQADEAKKALDQAAAELAQRRREAEAELATEQVARIQDAVEALHQRQLRAIEEVRRLDGLRQAQPRLTDAQAASLGQTAREQRMLQQETSRLGDKLDAAAVFQLALSGAAGEMAQAAGWLDRQQTGESTQQAQQAALARLAMLLEALKPEPPEPKPEEGGDPQGGVKGGASPPPGEGIPPVAQLKLLRFMQQDLTVRTEAWEKQHGAAPSDDAARRQYEQLAAEQGQLADLMLRLLQPQAAPPEEGLPEGPDEGE